MKSALRKFAGDKLHINVKAVKPPVYLAALCATAALILALLIAALVLAFPADKKVDREYYGVKDSSTLEYEVFLLPNKFFPEDKLSMDEVYIASIIDRIDASFDYSYDATKSGTMNVSYTVNATIDAKSKDNIDGKSVWKQTELLVTPTDLQYNGKSYDTSVKFSFDPKLYSAIIKDFAEQLQVTLVASLNVTLKVDTVVITDSNPVHNTHTHTLSLPLATDVFEISAQPKEMKATPYTDEVVIPGQPIYWLAAVLAFLALLLIVVLLFECSLLVSFSGDPYSVRLEELLGECDDRIVYVSTTSCESTENICVDDFDSVLRLADERNLPIFCVKTEPPEASAVFFVTENGRMYFYMISAGDFLSMDEALKDAIER